MTEEPKIEQRHRDAAADLIENRWMRDRVRLGLQDTHPLVVAFARFEQSLTKPSDDVREALADLCAAMEYWAGCNEACSEDEASSEIMSSGGAWPSLAYEKARALLRQPEQGRE